MEHQSFSSVVHAQFVPTLHQSSEECDHLIILYGTTVSVDLRHCFLVHLLSTPNYKSTC